MEEIALEFRGAKLGDPRRSARMERIGVSLARDPRLSFPDAMGDEGQLEGLYRFLGNEAVTPQAVLEPHQQRTRVRCTAEPTVLILHDTSAFAFSGEREGLGRLQTSGQGFFLHASLAVTPQRQPLGILRAETWTRTTPPRKKSSRGKRSNTREIRRDPKRESLRWGRAIAECEEDLNLPHRAVHIADREGDNFDLFSELESKRLRYVIRLAHDRNVVGEDEKLFSVTSRAAHVLTRRTRISARKSDGLAKKTKIHPAREERDVTLHVSAQPVEIARPSTFAASSPRTLKVNVVIVKEWRCPAGEKPVQWHLVTSEPIDTTANLEAVVDAYRARWMIEELFKALKTGCQFEKRQLESLRTLRNALCLFLPIAVSLLSLRDAARSQPSNTCTSLSAEQLEVLRAFTRKSMSSSPTNSEVYTALAALGGHLKSNGPPGWIVLGRAYEKLLALEQGWKAAMAARRCDR